MKKLLQGPALAGLLALSACAAMSPETAGFVTRQQEAQIKLGMSADEVRQTIGPPFNIVQYRNQPQPNWVYRAPGSNAADVLFHVEFGADGRVRAASEQEIRREAPTGVGM